MAASPFLRQEHCLLVRKLVSREHVVVGIGFLVDPVGATLAALAGFHLYWPWSIPGETWKADRTITSR